MINVTYVIFTGSYSQICVENLIQNRPLLIFPRILRILNVSPHSVCRVVMAEYQTTIVIALLRLINPLQFLRLLATLPEILQLSTISSSIQL